MSVLKSILTRTEYLKWLAYKTHKQPDSLEIQMAVLTAMVAGGLGVKNVSADDYIIHKPEKYENSSEQSDEEKLGIMSSDEVQAFFGVIAEPMK